MDICLRQPSNSVKRFADAHKVTSYLTDGNDVVAVAEVAQKAIKDARSGAGPSFVEAVTFRWRGHVGPDMDIDVGVSRSLEELRAWQERDPLRRLEKALLATEGGTEESFEDCKAELDQMLYGMLEKARAAGSANKENTLGFVYAAD